MKTIVTQSEFNGWIKYFQQKPADINEIQLALIATLISHATGGKAKVNDFIISRKDIKKDETPEIMSPEEVANIFRSFL